MTVHHQEQGLVCWTSGSKRATWPKRDRRRLKSGYGYSALAFTCTLRCKRTHHRHQVHGWYHQSAEWSCLLHSTNSALLDPALERSHLPPAYCHWYQQRSPRQLQRTHIYIYIYIHTYCTSGFTWFVWGRDGRVVRCWIAMQKVARSNPGGAKII